MTPSDPLLKPFTLKSLVLKNRVMSTSHACGLGDHEHMPADAYQAYHVEKARGGLALTMFGGSSYVSADSKWSGGQLDISTDAIVPHLEQFSERIHAEGAALMIQITHLGRRAETNTQAWLPTVAPSTMRESGHRSIPRQMDRHDMDRIVRQFGDAAERAEKGGLDGLEVMTHGHLIGQFLSPVTNLRTDEFGGSVENRTRFGVMVLEEIRKRVSARFIVGLRFAIDEGMAGGSDFEDSLALLKVFEGRGLIDFVNANYGRLDTEHALVADCMPGMQSVRAPWLKKAADFKQAIDLPVFHAAKINDIATARHAISEGLLDMVAMTRAHIADPHIVKKIMRGEEHRIRPCVGATHCMSDSRPTCLHNAATGRERRVPQGVERSDGPLKRVVVVGGGPAGLESARICGERGHSVVLFEAASQLGGQIRLADRASWRRDLSAIVTWRQDELAALDVDVRLNTYADPDVIAGESPDVVIFATGGLPDLGWIEGADLVTSVWDVLDGAIPTGDQILVYDGTGRHPAPTTAEVLLNHGKSIDYVMIDDVVGKELAYGERVIWKRRFQETGVLAKGDYKLVSVARSGNGLAASFRSELTDQMMTVQADCVVAETGTVPFDDDYQVFRERSVNQGVTDIDALAAGERQPALDQGGLSVFRIGDAAGSRNVAAAIYDALRLCAKM